MCKEIVLHTVTKGEASRLGKPWLAGEIVEISPEIRVIDGKKYRTAADVYYNGRRIAGLLILDNQSRW